MAWTGFTGSSSIQPSYMLHRITGEKVSGSASVRAMSSVRATHFPA
jgi:hypothetical protein